MTENVPLLADNMITEDEYNYAATIVRSRSFNENPFHFQHTPKAYHPLGIFLFKIRSKYSLETSNLSKTI